MKRGDLYCKAVSFRRLPELIRKLGGNPERLFAQAGLNMAHIKSDNYYDWNKLCGLFTRLVDTLDEPSLGIKYAYDVPKDFLNSGPMLLLAALVPTMRDFLDLSIKYQTLHINSYAYHYVENTNTNELECEIQIHPLSPPCQQFTEHIMAMVILMMRHHIGEAEFLRLSFQHKAPVDLSWHEKTFQCPIEFNADKNVAYMPLELLDVKLGGRLKALQPIVKSYLDRKIIKNPQYETSMAHTVERLLPSIFGLRKSSMPDVADILDISPKKLQRLLNDEGVTFSDIIGNVRKGMAKRLLYESDISMSHLAVLLDYSSTESFNTACNRWFGMSPRHYRKKVRAPQELSLIHI